MWEWREARDIATEEGRDQVIRGLLGKGNRKHLRVLR